MSDLHIVDTTTGEIRGTINADRVKRLQAATQRANRRDFDNRYGNNKRLPYGVVAPTRKRTPKRPTKPSRGATYVRGHWRTSRKSANQPEGWWGAGVHLVLAFAVFGGLWLAMVALRGMTGN